MSRTLSPSFNRPLVYTLCLVTALALARDARAQFGGGTGGGTGGTGGGTGSTIGASQFAGVAVDADGVLKRREVTDPTGELIRTRIEQAQATLGDVAQSSKLRKISLTRLIAAATKAIKESHGPDEVMVHLAGLTRIQYVFYYPETKDIVIAGPAEGWVETPDGRVVGFETGRPVMLLEDLAAALRTFAPSGKKNPLVYCSIDPTQDGLARMQQFLSQMGRQIVPGDEQFIVEGLRESLGLQTITVGGVPAGTHFAQVMVEADYRMKLIGIGLEQPPVNILSFVALANPAQVARNALQRWYFVPDYKRIKVSDDGLAAEFVGPGVKLVGEDEVVSEHGGRQATAAQSPASRKFTRSFTEKYGELAERAPVYGQLRNCIDMLVAAAYIQQHDLYAQAGVDLGALGDESAYPIETYNAPKQVATAVSSMWKGRRLMTPVGGGVEIRASKAVAAENTLADDGAVAQARQGIDISSLPVERWWWD
ncbi:MAG: DUF1598 domain-containing protein [Pirellulales bacterium]|nr:DUF1598 domain-containing protein [Pirellulales bacterium]